MSDPGRARGRARRRSGEVEAGSSSSQAEGTSSEQPSEAEAEPAMRGRGGFRGAIILNTIPSTVSVTTGDGMGPLKLLTNYFRLRVPTDQVIYCYRVDFEPNVEAIRVRRGLVFSISSMFKDAYIFDGGNEIKSLQQIHEEVVTDATKRDGSIVKVTIRPTSTVGWGHAEMLRLYNTQMRRNLQHLNFIQVGRDFYDKENRKRLQDHDIEIWPGILTAINEHDGGILMCTDIIHKIIRRETALDVLRQYLNRNRDNFRDIARREMPGKIVMTRYNNKTYRIDDVLFDKNPVTCTFDRNGSQISLKDYYAEQYSQTCEDERQPLLLVQPTEKMRRAGDDKEILLIPEFCLMTGLTDQMRTDFVFKRALGELTRISPVEKVQQLQAFMRKMKENEKIRTEMGNWRLGFEDKLVEMNGRTLAPEKILTWGEDGDQAGVGYDQPSGNFERDIRSKKMFRPVKIEHWALIAVERDRSLVDELFNCFRRVCGPLGIEMGKPRMFPIRNDRSSTYLDACQAIPEGAKMVVVLVPNNNADRYSTVKRYFCCERPIATQVITNRVLSNKKNQMSVVTKVLIQMATKLGAEPWAVWIPPKQTMVIGYDTYHDSEKRGMSVGGFVCSTNSSATSWFSRTTYHQNRDELCANFASNFRMGLKNWHMKNGAWPTRIVVYRDGVSEGQIPHVFNVELKDMRSVLSEKEELSKIPFVFIIVTKRVNARFFQIFGRELRNPPPGSMIDNNITRKERYDFYLISQSVRQGTVNPTMYNIIADSTGWKPQNHQALAYKMCHLYYNWAGTISVPAPCQYAHKLAHLTGTALHKEHHQSLAHNLFFL